MLCSVDHLCCACSVVLLKIFRWSRAANTSLEGHMLASPGYVSPARLHILFDKAVFFCRMCIFSVVKHRVWSTFRTSRYIVHYLERPEVYVVTLLFKSCCWWWWWWRRQRRRRKDENVKSADESLWLYIKLVWLSVNNCQCTVLRARNFSEQHAERTTVNDKCFSTSYGLF